MLVLNAFFKMLFIIKDCSNRDYSVTLWRKYIFGKSCERNRLKSSVHIIIMCPICSNILHEVLWFNYTKLKMPLWNKILGITFYGVPIYSSDKHKNKAPYEHLMSNEEMCFSRSSELHNYKYQNEILKK